MAKTTSYSLRKESIYQIFPRVYSRDGNLKAVENDLNRINSMGFKWLYFLPLHEPGILNRKGTLGSPYSIRDYYKINPDYGTLDDFKSLINKAHDMGMKVMMDIVINHTACDAMWVDTDPEFYLLDSEGKPTRKVADWSDILDLDYSNSKLQEELHKMLEYWAKFGVDGFRCDVAPLVNIDFWNQARKRLKAINPDFILLAESGEEKFVAGLREEGIEVLTDNELYEAFDVCYCYDVIDYIKKAFDLSYDLKEFANVLNYQQIMLPKNAVKCWFVENHDIDRVMNWVNDINRAENWMAFILLMKGMGFVYAGQEFYNKRRPSLFEKEDIDWSTRNIHFENMISRINSIKSEMFSDEEYVNLRMLPYSDVVAFRQYDNHHAYLGFFDIKGLKSTVNIDFLDGIYTNLIDDTGVEIKNGLIQVDRPILIKIR
ncbi:MAG: alpha-amylase family glycosyl hydrolase [Erysipelotrichaceae bacterium]